MVQRATLTLTPGQLHSVVGKDFGSVGDGFSYLDDPYHKLKPKKKREDNKPIKLKPKKKKITPRQQEVSRIDIGKTLLDTSNLLDTSKNKEE